MEIVVQKRSDYITLADDIAFVSEKLTKSENEILALSIPTEGNLKVKHSDLITLAETISNTVNVRLGWKKREDPDEIIFLSMIEKDCNKFPELTTGEILTALEMGLDGRFNPNPEKDIFFTSSIFVKWIWAFIDRFKKPVMAKHSQLIHQLQAPSIEPTKEERIKMAADVANRYADDRTKDPHHRVHGAGELFKTLELLEIHTLSLEEREALAADVRKIYPKASREELRALCQNEAYNRLIGELVEFEMMINHKGEFVDLHVQLEIRRLSLLFEEIVFFMNEEVADPAFIGVVHEKDINNNLFELRETGLISLDHEYNFQSLSGNGETLFAIGEDMYIICKWNSK